MKKTLVVLTACMLAFGVAACGNDTTKETETEETTTAVETTVESEVDETESKFKDSKSHEEIPGDKDSDVKDDGTIDTIKDILEEDGYKDEFYDEKEPSTDVADEVHEYVTDCASDADDVTEKPSVPRKLVIEE